ncbi:MAG: hypothetical protein LRY54_02340 [Alphaproteobacteria bacterium]|nr:hypothetical protein [Alphaproteobacteria bacterium]
MTSLKNIFDEGACDYKPTITITGPADGLAAKGTTIGPVVAASEGWGGVGTKDIPIWALAFEGNGG